MEVVVASSYQPGYVALSYAVSVLGGFVALTAAQRIRREDGSLRHASSWAAGLALGGIGVWSMHFIGMVALKLEAASSYSLWETIVSLLAAIVGSSLALGYVARAPHRLGRLFIAGFVLGMGVVVMHYLGMYGMKISGYIRWNAGVIGASAVIAVLAATAALWLAFNTGSRLLRAGAALVMGFAVCSMHYTGMGAAEFVCTTDPTLAPRGFGLFSAAQLPAVVAFVALTTAAMIVVYQVYQDSTEDIEGLEAASRFR
ncbi:histidine kinase [Ramlibacter sp. USB13]|uniref:Histidine kinase n=1 Tax=Ramlibacter cellulosilyticus TaxID=2764187 RepID=A0A923SCW5_9BURK|nr:MHYT domain-containing protein [Ramlibacter cellulosilyticus]MBC5785304.1 histidine kinase [Ramlibacter cellulosilyticus]